MGRLSKVVIVLTLICGCMEDPYEPNWLFLGDWIDIDGRDRVAQDTCGGTFEYVDAYAGALAVEFGVTEHLGSYRWYSLEQNAAELPCDEAFACASIDDRILHTPALPDEHEMVHLANFAAGACPSALAEGLAGYYGGFSNDAKTSDFDLLVTRLQAPSEHPSGVHRYGYGILGRFVAYLVERFGLEAVLDVCRTTGYDTTGPALSAAMQSVLGMTTEELLADFEPELGSCNKSKYYQSRVFACGAAAAAPDLGLVSETGEHGIEATFTLDCANDMTIGPLGGKIWTAARFDVDADGIYIASMQADGIEIPEVELTLAHCEPCGRAVTLPGEFIGPEQLRAGRYALELRAPADFNGSVTVRIE
jgi:hypothetical protein